MHLFISLTALIRVYVTGTNWFHSFFKAIGFFYWLLVVAGDVTPTSFCHRTFDATQTSGQSGGGFSYTLIIWSYPLQPSWTVCVQTPALFSTPRPCLRFFVPAQQKLHSTQELAFLTETQFLSCVKGEELVWNDTPALKPVPQTAPEKVFSHKPSRKDLDCFFQCVITADAAACQSHHPPSDSQIHPSRSHSRRSKSVSAHLRLILSSHL